MTSPPHPLKLLGNLGREYRRIRETHKQSGGKRKRKRRIAGQMEKIAERFETLLQHWVLEAQKRTDWRDFIYHGAREPEEIALDPPLFVGVTEAGREVKVLPTAAGGYDVILDGAKAEHHDVPWVANADRFAPVLVGDWVCRETFTAPASALEALDAFLASAVAEPPWGWARALFDDGLIDANFSLTDRGARRSTRPTLAVRREREEKARMPPTGNFCVVVANAGRARVFLLHIEDSESNGTYRVLTEVADAASRTARARDHEQFSASRPGLRQGGPKGPRHAVSDRRDENRERVGREYLQKVVRMSAGVWGDLESSRIVLVASTSVLSRLRPLVEKAVVDANRFSIDEYRRDLTWQGAAAIHDALAEAGLLPARMRLPPIRPMRTPNPWQAG